MPELKPQSFANHAKFDPQYHFVLAPIALGNVIAMAVNAVRHPSLASVWWVVLAAAGLLAVFKLRIYALKVQDRVIRLEERLRLALLLPEPLRARISELTEPQLVGLRFASDAELPQLVDRTLNDGLSMKQIKQSVQHWRADHFRV